MSDLANLLPVLAEKPRLKTRWEQLWRSDFVRKVGETYVTQIMRTALSVATTVLVARMLGPEGRGLYAVAAIIGALGVQFGNLGLHASNTYFVAKNPSCARQLMGNSLVAGFGFGSLISIVLCLVFRSYPDIARIPWILQVLALFSIPLGLTYLLMQNLLVGLHRVRPYNLIELVNKAVPTLLLLALILVHAVSVPAVFGTTLLALTASCAWILSALRKQGSPRVSLALFQANLSYGMKSYLTCFFGFVVLRTSLLLVQHILGAEQVGYYSIAATMADTIALLTTVIGLILFPKLSAVPDIAAKLALTRRAVAGTVLLLLPLIVVASLLAKPLVKMVFGSAFAPASLSFVLLMPGTFFIGIHTVTVQFLNSVGYPVSVVAVWAFVAVASIGLNLWAIPRYGIAGAAVVSSICYFLACLLVVLLVMRYGQRQNCAA